MIIIDENGDLHVEHAGTPHEGSVPHSGRYKWGSGENPYQSSTTFLAEVDRLMKKEGMSEVEAARALGMNTAQLRARKTAAKSAKREGDIAIARQMREKGSSYGAIAERLGVSAATAKKLAEGGILTKTTKAQEAKAVLEAAVAQDKFIDYGLGTEIALGVSTTQLKTAVQMLKDEGYESYTLRVKQLGRKEQFTELKVLCPPGTTFKEAIANKANVRAPRVTIDESGHVIGALQKPVSVSSKRLKVRYAEDGGIDMDGVIELRRKVPGLEIANGRYAQVRILVDGTHYLKGMAVYSDNMPDGVDIRFNTNKKRGTPPLGPKDHTVLKPIDKNDPTNPFGSAITQKRYIDPKTGRKRLSALNYVHEEGDWDDWNRALASQYLGKQRLSEAKKQLAVTQKRMQREYEAIMAITNPVVRRKLLLAFADSCDGKSVDLKAAAYPRQASQVILPVPSMNPKEVYAPNYRHGETVALVRFPHAGTFEIPILTVNNKHMGAQRRVGKNARDAIGIHPSVAERLSGADFDGDSVLVIPNNDGRVKSSPPLKGLEGFDPKRAYPYRPGMKVMSKKYTQKQMGVVSNLITDMTLQGATPTELARAVRHSMVVIDAAKHRLDYKQSEKDNGIAQLKKKYQPKGGASTLLSRSKSPVYIEQERPRRASEGGPIDPRTGRKVMVPTGAFKYKKYKDPKTGEWVVTDEKVMEMQTVPKMSRVSNAHRLSSGTPMESAYADHANAMKALGNQARKSSLRVGKTPYSPTAAKQYSPEVESLRAKLKRAYAGKPLERQAQVVANAKLRLAMQDDPDLRDDLDRRAKLERRLIADARLRVGADHYRVTFTDKEWEAVQHGAITENFLSELIANADADHVREMASPRAKTILSSTQQSKIRQLRRLNYTNADIADVLGVSASTVRNYMAEEGL